MPWQSPGDPAYKTVSSLGGQIAKRPFSELCTHKPGPGFDGYMMVGLQAHFAGGQVVLQALSSLALVKILLANAGNVRDAGSITGSGRSPGGGHSNPLQYSCLENPHGQRSLVGCSPKNLQGSQRVRQDQSTHTCKVLLCRIQLAQTNTTALLELYLS